MGTTAFADESKAKGFRFLITVIDDADIARVRSVVGAWRAPGSRSFHASQESPARRRRALRDVAELGLCHVLIEVDGPVRQYVRRHAGVATARPSSRRERAREGPVNCHTPTCRGTRSPSSGFPT
jgi:hypothetical protein